MEKRRIKSWACASSSGRVTGTVLATLAFPRDSGSGSLLLLALAGVDLTVFGVIICTCLVFCAGKSYCNWGNAYLNCIQIKLCLLQEEFQLPMSIWVGYVKQMHVANASLQRSKESGDECVRVCEREIFQAVGCITQA